MESTQKDNSKHPKYKNLPEEYPILEYFKIIERNELNFVYKPAEDTFLFLDTLYMERESILK
jgi:hypothetical protein